jgi:hypothetical protein
MTHEPSHTGPIAATAGRPHHRQGDAVLFPHSQPTVNVCREVHKGVGSREPEDALPRNPQTSREAVGTVDTKYFFGMTPLATSRMAL